MRRFWPVASISFLLTLTAAAAAHPFQLSPEERARQDQLSREDHADMLRQLGITRLRPGANGRATRGEAGAANYDPAQANSYPDWPDILTLKDGRKVTNPEAWWQRRRPEIAEDFEREVYGRVPRDVPPVAWTVAESVETTIGGQPVVARRVVGHVDNSAHPAIAVDIRMAVVLPRNANGPVPVLIMFGGGNMPGDALPRFGNAQEPAAPPSTEQLIASGWGYVSLSTSSIQADNGAGLTGGIIGLTNKGQRRTPEQWGSLRAWGWGASRALDYLETLPAVNARRVGIEGVSRYGKAALVAMAFEPRFAVVLVGSSGEGGAKPHRRNFGEQVENLTGSGEYHWMAGNFLKYGASEALGGSRNANDIPVDAHQLIALCAPRPTFISYGVPEKGDPNWLDQQGRYMATVAAGPVFRLLGAHDTGVSEDYRVAKMPPHNTSLLDGELAWRQHDGGHEDRSNMSFFISWANRLFAYAQPTVPADQPRMRADRNSHLAHQQLLAKAKSGGIDVYFEGDSITRRWGALDYPDFLAHWTKTFHGWNAANFGWGADRTENILWRLENGELDGVNPKVIVILAGTNNVGREPGDEAKAADVARGVSAIVTACRKRAAAATIILTAIFPRNDNPAVMPTIDRINASLARLADGQSVRFLEVNSKLADANGVLFEGMMGDGLHPTLKGYEVWALGLKPILLELLGPPAAADHAPKATGDPSAAPNSPLARNEPRPAKGTAAEIDAQRTYENPILHSDYSDPDVIRVGDRYYMTASTFHFSPGLPVLESRDLVHWALIGHALPRLPFHPKYNLPGPLGFSDNSERARFNPDMGHRYGQGVWAPAIRFHRNRFYIYFATPTEGIFMVSAKRPEGPWEAPVTIVGEPGLEDPCPFWDDDGNAYLVHSKVGAGPLVLRRLSADGKKALDRGKVIVEDPRNLPTLEGPKFLKRNGWYYIFAPYGGVERGPQAVLRSRSIYGPYEARTVLAQGKTSVQAPHQGGYVETPSGEGWFVHFNSTGAYGRIVHLQPVTWQDDWPLIGEPLPGSTTTGQPVTTYRMPDAGRAAPPVFPQTTDEFTDERLGVQWEWNHNPVDTLWSLRERRGYLRLTAGSAPDFLSARNTLTQVLHGRASRTSIRLDVSGLVDGQRAGLAMLQVQPSWIGVVQTGGQRRLVWSSAGEQVEGPTLDAASVTLRMDVENEAVEYAYSLDDGKAFVPLGRNSRLRFSWWKGARPALFSFSLSGPGPKPGHADFDWIRVEQPARK